MYSPSDGRYRPVGVSNQPEHGVTLNQLERRGEFPGLAIVTAETAARVLSYILSRINLDLYLITWTLSIAMSSIISRAITRTGPCMHALGMLMFWCISSLISASPRHNRRPHFTKNPQIAGLLFMRFHGRTHPPLFTHKIHIQMDIANGLFVALRFPFAIV